MENKKKNLDTIKLSTLEKTIRRIKKEIAPKKDCDISFEFIIGSFFPDIMNNIKNEFTRNYLEGYKAAKEEKENESKRNN